MYNTFTFEISEKEAGSRLDAAVSGQAEEPVTRNLAQSLIEDGNVQINGKVCLSKKQKVSEGEKISVSLPIQGSTLPQPENIPLDICYEDDDLLIVNKPKGMVVHPAAGNTDGTLVNALLYHCGGKLSHVNTEERPGIVHRIDKDTSGLLVVAKTDEAHLFLADLFARHDIRRTYHAVVYGNLKEDTGTVDAPIGRNPKDRKKMAVNREHGKRAVTHYQVLARFPGFTYISCQLETGRTHQIRVHMASIGHPLAGDAVYGPKRAITELQGQCLHAKSLGFIHPTTKKEIYFDSDLPDYFIHFLNILKNRSKV